MVVIYAADGRPLQEGVDYTAAPPGCMEHADSRLHEFIEGMKYWIRGYQDWVVRDTQRYAVAYAADDADDRMYHCM